MCICVVQMKCLRIAIKILRGLQGGELALSHIKTYTTVTSKSLILEENREHSNRSQCISKFGVFRSARKYNLANGTGIPQNTKHVH